MTPVSAETMRELDRLALKNGISALSLMENAGEAISKKAAALLRGSKSKKVVIFCGKGNNGGDGFVTARKLAKDGFEVRAYLFGKADSVKNEALVSLDLFIAWGGEINEITSGADIERLKGDLDYPLAIDAILGTGFSGPLSGVLEGLIRLLNTSHVPILSVDVPSGLDPTTGDIGPVAITANWTITFALPKKGFCKKNGPNHTGEIEVVNIGFPKALVREALEFDKKYD